MTTVAELHPRTMAALYRAQDSVEGAWRAHPDFPHRCRPLEVLAGLDGVVARAHVDLPSGILTMAYMEPAVTRDARRALARARRLLSPLGSGSDAAKGAARRT